VKRDAQFPYLAAKVPRVWLAESARFSCQFLGEGQYVTELPFRQRLQPCPEWRVSLLPGVVQLRISGSSGLDRVQVLAQGSVLFQEHPVLGLQCGFLAGAGRSGDIALGRSNRTASVSDWLR
jgi:hypothetical protein